MFLIELLIVLLLVIAGVVAMVLQARSSTTSDARRITRGVAQSFAGAPGVVQALEAPHPSAVLEPQAEAVRQASGVDSVVVFNRDFVQLTSPYPDYVGRPYQPPPYVLHNVLPKLLAGQTVTFEDNQPGFDSIATAVPVFDAAHRPLGAVAVNITVGRVNALADTQLPVLLGGAAIAVLLAAAGAAFASRRLQRQTRGLGPTELSRMYEHHEAVLHAVREGVLIIGGDGRLTLANDEALRLLDLPSDAEQQSVAALDLDPATTALLTSPDEVTDGIHRAGDRLLAVNKRPTAPYGGLPGSVVTLRDTTELHDLTSRIEAAGRRRRVLYEAGMRIGRTLDMTRTCEELADVALGGFADAVSVDLVDAVTRGEEPPRTAGLLRRTVLRGDPRGGGHDPAAPVPVPAGTAVSLTPDSPQALALADEHAVPDADHRTLTVPLRMRGGVLGLVEFRRAAGSPPFDADDLPLAEDLAARAAVSVDNARRYTREHGTAVALQRSLLPRSVPDRTGLELAHRYLPASAGVGGDWFDVIPLPGFRTALVVGDVVGHGINAAVAMGRLRTAIRTFAALDLPPDEVLGRLDELVTQLDEEAEEIGAAGGTGESDPSRADGVPADVTVTGSTCLYAVYDPVSGLCTLSSAGHLGPAVVRPDGIVDFPEVAVAPPLGVGGHPFETSEIRLDPGSRLLLFSDGLVEARGEDIDEGLRRLRDALEDHSRALSPEEICAVAVRAAPPPQPTDDVVLLVAGTALLPPEQIAEWEVPGDAAAVGPVRNACVKQLAEWGLEDISFSAELILSELITNAIRYGAAPVRVRLLRDTGLVCEVSDGSSTAPHLRWAATTDEGGRGIFLVAQLAHRWGTRYTASGKVIWSEQPLTGDGGAGDGIWGAGMFGDLEEL
ncbi:SpoIIE family protein phosphatase/ATP-binding protein [Streptacidiphilus fuscans]|uniref:protein-serine/threonine phosphatase n=1 Tax=Streptacidiphilus fuscans TaxID=2789292 RepID=A0A931B4R4_9ACTN|nr:SpoIIE family protein phosphatase/ATP-binding protein [Streptacidiphilus fuscans]MBF9066885.1 SpoIIE family protein phosphatase [Streptacidiphilus fuscans]